jgi:mRNA-degrading endonuclease RelE of RelBE toxin-antitoxin system
MLAIRTLQDGAGGGSPVPYRIEFSPEAVDHLDGLTARQRSSVLDAIERQLLYQPRVETRQRRPLRPNPLAEYRLRVGDLRVYDDVRHAIVLIKAVGIKLRNRVLVGGKEIEL